MNEQFLHQYKDGDRFPKCYYVSYRNLGRPERTPAQYPTEALARECARFLKFQGATAVRVHQEK